MDAKALREMQAPIKDSYREAPEGARLTLKAEGRLDGEGIACKVDTGRALVTAGLHPKTGGSGQEACSGDMLLEALAACAGVTLKAVATAMAIDLKPESRVLVEGDLDFRGTLGVDKAAPVGFSDIRLTFDIASDAEKEQVEKLIATTERYCVVFQTLNQPPRLAVGLSGGA